MFILLCITENPCESFDNPEICRLLPLSTNDLATWTLASSKAVQMYLEQPRDHDIQGTSSSS